MIYIYFIFIYNIKIILNLMSLVLKKIADQSHLQVSDENTLLMYYYNDQLYVKRYMDIEDIPILNLKSNQDIVSDYIIANKYLVIGNELEQNK